MINILPEQLKKLRKQKGLTYEQMGEKVGVNYRTIKRYELGASQPTADILEEYTKKFGVTFEYLYYGEEISDMELYNEFKRLSPKRKRAVMAVMEAF